MRNKEKSMLNCSGPLSYYHLRSPKSGDTVLVGATDPRAREARTIDNYVKDRNHMKPPPTDTIRYCQQSLVSMVLVVRISTYWHLLELWWHNYDQGRCVVPQREDRKCVKDTSQDQWEVITGVQLESRQWGQLRAACRTNLSTWIAGPGEPQDLSQHVTSQIHRVVHGRTVSIWDNSKPSQQETPEMAGKDKRLRSAAYSGRKRQEVARN